MYAQPELQLQLSKLGVLALVAESNDVARVAASLNISCATVRDIAAVAAHDMLSRYNALRHPNDHLVAPNTYPVLIQCVKNVVRSDVVNAVAILSARERLEVFESFAYFRAFCNSSVQKSEINHG